jgi:NADH-quinone oxidoreductase subunit N
LNLSLLAPELSIVVTAVAVILLDLFVQKKALLVATSLAGLAVALVFSVTSWAGLGGGVGLFGGMLAVDGFAIFFKVIFIGTAALVILMSQDYVGKFPRFQGEYYALVLIATVGMMFMAATADLISIYVALELASITLYVLTGFLKDGKSGEASLKYLLLGAIASATLLYGMALVFGVTGSTRLGVIGTTVAAMDLGSLLGNPALMLGIILLIAGFGFKIAAVPFHLWVPDVYEGAPTTVTAFLSVGSKAAGFALLMRVFTTAFGSGAISQDWGMIFAVLAAVSMTVGNVVALRQNNIKRMLGYSSIAQAGYIMVGLATLGMAGSGERGVAGVMFFLAAYALTNLGAFTAIVAITNKIKSDEITDFGGMVKRAPVLALGLSFCLISLIGMPPAAGFLAKVYIFSGAINAGLVWLVVIAVLNSVISAFYYLRVVKVMWLGEPAETEPVPSSLSLRLALLVTCLGVLVLGVVPGMLMRVAEAAAAIFTF